MVSTDTQTYTSPFSWRYASPQMRAIFSEEHKYRLWRQIWVALAKAQHKAGLVSSEELSDLEQHQNEIDIEKILELEKETKHDLFAAIKEFASHAPIGGGKIHLGATSMDVVDNADMMRMKEALVFTRKTIVSLVQLFAEKIEQYTDTPCMAYTHLQPAEPTTLGYRFAFYAQDLVTNLEFIDFVLKTVKGKGMKGAVGTAASYAHLLKSNSVVTTLELSLRMTAQDLEKDVMEQLGVDAALISTQVYPRQYDYLILSALNAVASTLSKFAADVRFLQTPAYAELAEPFGKKQVGSSAMPFKRNPIMSEKICSLARYVNQLPAVALENASLSYLERTLDDSANKRIIMPEGFLAVDEILQTAMKLVDGLVVNEQRINYNLAQYGPFAASEAILMEAVKKGADRQEMHEVLREVALSAWQEVQMGKANPMEQLLMNSTDIQKYISKETIQACLDVKDHIGNAPERARKLVKVIKNLLL